MTRLHIHRFAAVDLPWVKVQAGQKDEWQCSEVDMVARGRVYEVFEHGYTIRGDDGAILLCIGLIPHHARNFTAWAMVSADIGHALQAVTHWARGYLDGLSFDRVDMQVREGFTNGDRWARALYFEVEHVKARWYPDGASLTNYVRFGKEATDGPR